jgi:uncharacterized sulfatase
MPPSEQTIAELLKPRGYHNIHIGKWHLGSTPEMRPNNQGFDETLFMESGLYLPVNDPGVVNSRQDFDPIDKFLWPNMRFGVSYNGGKWFEPSKYLTDYYTDEAVTAIKRNKNRPFFLYLAHWGVHTPLQASKADYDSLPNITDHRQRVYAAMVKSVDRSVGRVLQTLREEGLDDNTIVIFTSDNGPEFFKPWDGWAGPWRGQYFTALEGGIRVPFLIRWPGKIEAGRVSNEIVHGADMFATLAKFADAKVPDDGRPMDSLDQSDFLLGRTEKSAREGFPIFCAERLQAVKWRNWISCGRTQCLTRRSRTPYRRSTTSLETLAKKRQLLTPGWLVRC